MSTDEQTERTRLAVLSAAVERLEQADIEHPRRNAEWLLADVLNCDRAQLYAYSDAPVRPDQARRFEASVKRRVAREPLQYIVGHTDFYGLQLAVTPAVLIPRPETEELVERVLQRLVQTEVPRVLDVGTGSGCIALALKHARPDAVVHACDVSAAALQVAEKNAEVLELSVTFHEADVLRDDFPAEVGSPFDVVVSNPPYVPDVEFDTLDPEVRVHEPVQALRSGEDPLRFYRALARHQARLLKPSGILAVEIHTDYAEKIAGLFAEHGLTDVHVHRDLSDRARMVEGRVSNEKR